MYLLYYNMKNMNIQEHFFEKTLDFFVSGCYNTLVPVWALVLEQSSALLCTNVRC